jgi:sugar phosphate isomerase/epimerase
MLRFSINEATTYHWSLLEDVSGYHAAGIRSIGVWRRKLCDFGEERGIELLRESDLEVSSLSSAGGFTGSDGQTFREAIDDALDAVRQAAEMHAGCLVVVPGAQAGHIYTHASRLLCDALRELGDAAGRLGLQIALQPMHRQPVERWSFLTTLDRTLELLAMCDHSRVGMVFDFFHLWREPALFARLPQIVPWIKLAALCDACAPADCDDDRCLPGRGDLPLAEIVGALETNGYRGTYDVQILSDRCWRSDYAALLADCRQALANVCPRTFPLHVSRLSHA